VTDAGVNRAYWDGYADEYQAAHAPMLDRPQAWGTYARPEVELGALGPLDALAGATVLDLGCGAAQWAGALTAVGARAVGLDASAAQLAHAVRRSTGARLVQGLADGLPFATAAFDLVLSDHGAMGYTDPERTVPEVARVLRPGGRLAFLVYSPLLALCWDGEAGRVGTALRQPSSQLGRWEDETGFVSWDLRDGEWLALLGRHGLLVEDLIELVAPPGATSTHHDAETTAWARRWPLEHLWLARRLP